MEPAPASVAHIVGLVSGLLLLSAAVHTAVRRTRFPVTVVLVLVGVVLAHLGRLGVPFLSTLGEVQLPPEVVIFVFLPVLVFESALNMEARALRENLAPILTLAVPGLVLSTALSGALLAWGTGMAWPSALLLASMLSATDPVGVVALFRQLGAPRRLAVLVEGESLFNDATSIVAARILQSMVLVGAVSAQTVLAGALEFLAVFVGGLVAGWIFAALIGQLMGRVEGDSFVEISLTAVLAYFAFLLAEEVLGVSGVMAAVAAGMLIGGWGKAKISPSVTQRMEHFWDYVGQAANALVFLLVGLTMDLTHLWESWHVLAVAILAMLLSRALVVYGLIPLVGRFPGTDPVDRRYQTVIFWGGLRGAIALAIALQLPEGLPGRDLMVTTVTGAVLFTLLVPGLTMGWLVRLLKLDIPPLSDRLARLEGLVSAKRRTLEQVPELQDGGLFSPRIARSLQERCGRELESLRRELEAFREKELDQEEERRLLYLRCFAEEKSLYHDMFVKGHLSEGAYRSLNHSLELQTESLRHHGRLPKYTLHPPSRTWWKGVILRSLHRLRSAGPVLERLRAGRVSRDYEVAWARFRASGKVLANLDRLASPEAIRPRMVEEVRAFYGHWHENARARMDEHAEQFPEFAAAMQERLAERMVLLAEREAIEEKAIAGSIPPGVAEAMLEEMALALRKLRTGELSKLRVDPSELLRKVPFFQDLPPGEFAAVADRLRPLTVPAGEVILRHGEEGDSLFLVARGVVRVYREEEWGRRDLATLLAGDFFGEMALLRGGRRAATCRAVTPCALYELRRQDIQALASRVPRLMETLEEADRRRREELESVSSQDHRPFGR